MLSMPLITTVIKNIFTLIIYLTYTDLYSIFYIRTTLIFMQMSILAFRISFLLLK